MKPGDLRIFDKDDDLLGADMFSGHLALLLQQADAQFDSDNPTWDVLIGGRKFRMSEGMLDRWSAPV
mgnify:CR=1 FL=1